MKVQELSFKNFRNLVSGKIEPGEGINIIHGENAQGKTNLIEAIWLFTGGRSFRSTKDLDLTTFGKARTKLSMQLISQDRDQNIKINLEKGARKVEVNMIKKKSSADLIGAFRAVIFSPTHLSLIKDGPSQRRRFLDCAMCQLWPVYTKNVIKYNKTVDQRNSLLKSCKKNPDLKETISIWDESLALCAAEITKRRLDYINLLRTHAGCAYNGISSGKEELALQYRSILPKNAPQDITTQAIADLYKEAFKESREEDLVMGFTTRGPHRDDLDIKVNGKHARIFCSQGQQRSAVLALKLAEAKIISLEKSEDPVILLDDVMSELDGKRQRYILNAFGELQVFITCCEAKVLDQITSGKTFFIEKGEIK